MTARSRLLFALVLALAALLSYGVAEALIGQGPSAPKETSPGQSWTTAGTQHPSVPATSVQASGDSPHGAVAVAARYLAVLDEASLTPATSAALRALTLPPLTEQALRVEAVSAAVKERLSDPGLAFIRGWRLGSRVAFFSARLARVAVWAMGIVQSPEEVLSADYSTTLCSLRWTATGWRVFGAATKPGPTPPIDGTDHSAVASFAREASRFQPFSDAP